MQDREYIEKWLSGSLNADEKVAFEETATFRGLQRMDNALQRFKPLPLDEQEVFNKIKSRREKSAKVVSINWPLVWRIAAILIVPSTPQGDLHMKRIFPALSAVAFSVAVLAGPTPAPEGAKAYIISPANGATVTSP